MSQPKAILQAHRLREDVVQQKTRAVVPTVWVRLWYGIGTAAVRYGYSCGTVWVRLWYGMGMVVARYGYGCTPHAPWALQCSHQPQEVRFGRKSNINYAIFRGFHPIRSPKYCKDECTKPLVKSQFTVLDNWVLFTLSTRRIKPTRTTCGSKKLIRGSFVQTFQRLTYHEHFKHRKNSFWENDEKNYNLRGKRTQSKLIP